MTRTTRDHGGGLDAAMAEYGGTRADWLDLSTGINPAAYPLPAFSPHDWNALPDQTAHNAAITAARAFWNVPAGADVLAVPGCSAPIAQIPTLHPTARVDIAAPTYNEHAAAFAYHGWDVGTDRLAEARVIVNPNNPTGHFPEPPNPTQLTIIDESFCDVAPDRSLIHRANQPGHLILKSFGKFWGLAGLRLGFVIGDPKLVDGLRQRIGPWPVSGPALRIGAVALADHNWASATRARLAQDADRMDAMLASAWNATPMGETLLFRTYHVADAAAAQAKLAKGHVWSRIFPYSSTWIRLGLPGTPADWAQLEKSL